MDLGINEAVAIPSVLWESDPAAASRRIDRRAELTRELGVRRVRVQSSGYPWLWKSLAGEADLTLVDEAFDRLDRFGLRAVVVIAPWPANEPWTAVADCRVRDPDYAERVREVVERFDGDGLDDGPGAGIVDAWEIDNEPDLHESLRPGFCPPSAFAETVKLTAAAIREADPDATILSGGLYNAGSPSGSAYAAALGALPVDAVAIHVYSDTPELAIRADLKSVRDGMQAERIWITEISSVGRSRGSSDKDLTEQARALAAAWGAAADEGVESFYWHTLVDPPAIAPGAIPSPGLYAWGDDLKPAGRVLEALLGACGPISSNAGLSWTAADGRLIAWGDQARVRVTSPVGLQPLAGRVRARRDGQVRLRGVAEGSVPPSAAARAGCAAAPDRAW